MDFLARFIIDRVKCKFHPFIPRGCGWRLHPPHMAEVLKHLEPLHIIAVSSAWIGVDGIFVEDVRGLREKYSVALKTVEAIFGEAVGEKCMGNLEVAATEIGLWILKFFQGSIWFIAVCTDLQPYPARFAFLADEHIPCMKARYVGERGRVTGVVAMADGAKVSFPVSEKFFTKPSAENAELFGDILFLAQMSGEWIVGKEIDVEYECFDPPLDDPCERIASVLKGCPGLGSLLRYVNIELLVGDPNSKSSRKWRELVKTIEERLK